MANTDRIKVLQTATLPMVRAMRAVFCWSCISGSSSGPLWISSSDDQGAFKAVLNVVEAAERPLDYPEDPTGQTKAQIGLYTHPPTMPITTLLRENYVLGE